MIKKNTSIENIKGIRISVETFYMNYYFFGKKKKYRFRNIITIYNQGKNTIQILFSSNPISPFSPACGLIPETIILGLFILKSIYYSN